MNFWRSSINKRNREIEIEGEGTIEVNLDGDEHDLETHVTSTTMRYQVEPINVKKYIGFWSIRN